MPVHTPPIVQDLKIAGKTDADNPLGVCCVHSLLCRTEQQLPTCQCLASCGFFHCLTYPVDAGLAIALVCKHPAVCRGRRQVVIREAIPLAVTARCIALLLTTLLLGLVVVAAPAHNAHVMCVCVFRVEGSGLLQLTLQHQAVGSSHIQCIA